MKILYVLLVAGLLGCYLGFMGCEKSSSLADSCAAEITDRLDLRNEPSESCSLSVVLYQTADETFYSVSSMTCYLLPEYYTCAGDTLSLSAEEARRRRLSAEKTTFLGFLPLGDCSERTTERLGLVAEPQTSCSTFVEMLRYDERLYFRYASQNCQLVAVPFDCAGEELCEAEDAECQRMFRERAEPVGVLGYLPE